MRTAWRPKCVGEHRLLRLGVLQRSALVGDRGVSCAEVCGGGGGRRRQLIRRIVCVLLLLVRLRLLQKVRDLRLVFVVRHLCFFVVEKRRHTGVEGRPVPLLDRRQTPGGWRALWCGGHAEKGVQLCEAADACVGGVWRDSATWSSS